MGPKLEHFAVGAVLTVCLLVAQNCSKIGPRSIAVQDANRDGDASTPEASSPSMQEGLPKGSSPPEAHEHQDD